MSAILFTISLFAALCGGYVVFGWALTLKSKWKRVVIIIMAVLVSLLIFSISNWLLQTLVGTANEPSGIKH